VQDPIKVTYGSTNHYLVGYRGGRLLVDAGYAGSLPQLRYSLKRYGIESSSVRHVMLTHHHPDHAGLTQEVKRAFGARLIIHEAQIPYLRELQEFHERRRETYEPIVVAPDDVVVSSANSRPALKRIGLEGEIVETPGHSPDSVSLVLDGGVAFVGDLHLPDQATGELLESVRESWNRLLGLGVRTAYPGHGGPVAADRVSALLASST
jgi:glyoxylase-like metal-dependent hydrolase (beta-lactamase superfamily II)